VKATLSLGFYIRYGTADPSSSLVVPPGSSTTISVPSGMLIALFVLYFVNHNEFH